MVRLTHSQEIQILNCLKNTFPDGVGSSRMTFDGDDDAFEDIYDMCEELGFDLHNCVIKVALGIGGQTQSSREVIAYEQHGDEYPLAKIYAIGRFVEIMIKIEEMVDWYYRDYCDCNETYCFYHVYGGTFKDEDGNEIEDWDADEMAYDYYPDDATPEDIEKHEEIFSTACQLEELFGKTGDNGQLGWDVNGNLVCYDYGFVRDSAEKWDSSLSSYMNGEDDRNYYLDVCIENVEASLEMIEALEKTVIDNIRDSFDDYEEKQDQEESDDYENDNCEDDDCEEAELDAFLLGEAPLRPEIKESAE